MIAAMRAARPSPRRNGRASDDSVSFDWAAATTHHVGTQPPPVIKRNQAALMLRSVGLATTMLPVAAAP